MTHELLADKLAVAAELVRHAEQNSSSDYAVRLGRGAVDWADVLRTLDQLADTVASARRTAEQLAG